MFKIFTIFADWVSWDLLKMQPQSHLGQSVHFFAEDTSKILILVAVMIYLIAWARASMNMDRVREFLQGKSRGFGYLMGSIFGAITPFCSCSSIPMFLGFTAAKIPVGVTLSFLITSPLLNEAAVVLLGSLLGWKFTLVYLAAGITAGVIGGIFFDAMKAEKLLQPLAANLQKNSPTPQKVQASGIVQKLTMRDRHNYATHEVKDIFSKIWIWVLLGVGAGAALHGFVPQGWIADHLGNGAWWSVPAAVVLGIPLYSNATGMIPVAESLLNKGLPVGTALALMMSTVGASFPEFILLKQVLKPKLLIWLFGYFLVVFTLTGWLINLIF